MIPQIGDAAPFLPLRRAAPALRESIGALGREMATGRRADPAAHLRGATAPLATLSAERTRIAAQSRAAEGAALRLDGRSRAITGFAEEAAAAARTLMRADPALPLSPHAMHAHFQTALDRLNLAFGGGHVLGGTDRPGPPLRPAEEILSAVRERIAGLEDPAEIATAIRTFFASAEPGDDAAILAAPPEPPRLVTLGDGPPEPLADIPRDPAIRQALAGLALATLADTPSADAAGRALRATAGEMLVDSAGGLTRLQADAGLLEERLARHQTRLAARDALAQKELASRLSADPFDVAARLRDAETRLEAVHLLTARLSRLSLSSFLR